MMSLLFIKNAPDHFTENVLTKNCHINMETEQALDFSKIITANVEIASFAETNKIFAARGGNISDQIGDVCLIDPAKPWYA